MGVTINKAKAKDKSEGKVVTVDGRYLNHIEDVDRLAELKAKITKVMQAAADKIAAEQKEVAEIETRLKSIAEDDLTSDKEAIFDGTQHEYVVSAKSNVSTVAPMKEVAKEFEKAQKGLFLDVASVTLKDMKQYLSGAVYDKLVTQARTGSRSGKLNPKK